MEDHRFVYDLSDTAALTLTRRGAWATVLRRIRRFGLSRKKLWWVRVPSRAMGRAAVTRMSETCFPCVFHE